MATSVCNLDIDWPSEKFVAWLQRKDIYFTARHGRGRSLYDSRVHRGQPLPRRMERLYVPDYRLGQYDGIIGVRFTCSSPRRRRRAKH